MFYLIYSLNYLMDILIFKNNLEFKLKKLIHLIIIKSKYFKILCS